MASQETVVCPSCHKETRIKVVAKPKSGIAKFLLLGFLGLLIPDSKSRSLQCEFCGRIQDYPDETKSRADSSIGILMLLLSLAVIAAFLWLWSQFLSSR